VIALFDYTFDLLPGATHAGGVALEMDNGGGLNAATDYTLQNLTVNANGTLTNPASTPTTVTVTAPVSWTGGDPSGAGQTVVSGTTNINADDSVFFDTRTLTNTGTTTWTGGSILAYDGAVFNNQPGAVFDARADVSWFWYIYGSAPVINNRGTFRK